MIWRIFQLQVTIKPGRELDDESVVFVIFDDERNIHQLRQPVAGNRISSSNARNRQYTRFELSNGKVIYNQLRFMKQNTRDLKF